MSSSISLVVTYTAIENVSLLFSMNGCKYIPNGGEDKICFSPIPFCLPGC